MTGFYRAAEHLVPSRNTHALKEYNSPFALNAGYAACTVHACVGEDDSKGLLSKLQRKRMKEMVDGIMGFRGKWFGKP